MSTDYTEPFAYGIQAPIGSVTPLFHKRKDAEDFISKLTDSRDEARIIPLYRASTTIETMLECWHRLVVKNDELYAEITRMRSEEAALRSLDASMAAAEQHDRLRLTDTEREAIGRLACACETSAFLRDPEMAATLRGLLERHRGKQ